jgi:hypothetical protein
MPRQSNCMRILAKSITGDLLGSDVLTYFPLQRQCMRGESVDSVGGMFAVSCDVTPGGEQG